MKCGFKKAAIIGTGLIGGSIALGLKQKKIAQRIVGVSRHKKNILKALKMKAIDAGSIDLGIIKGADLLIIATPVGHILNSGLRLKKLVGKDCLVTDVGSTKRNIVSNLERIFPNFIGAHPLAGSEKKGIQNASAGLFNQSICILTPTKNSDNSALLKTEKLWRALGARVIRLNPDSHDEALSFVSHLPHLVAFSLINTIPERFLGYSSGGLKDTTRIASSDHILWRDILLDNKDNVLKAIKLFEKSLNELRGALKCSDSRALGKIILKSKKKRARLQ